MASLASRRAARLRLPLCFAVPAPRHSCLAAAPQSLGAKRLHQPLVGGGHGLRVLPATARFFAGLVDVKTPDFGAESITEGTIMEWKKKPGDHCAKGEVICLIETDKVTVDVAAPEAGSLKEILCAADDTVQVGQVLAKFETGASSSGSTETSAPSASATPIGASSGTPAAGPDVEVKTPDFGAESITEGTIMEWKKKVGDPVAKGDLLVMIETDKVTIEVNASEAGTLKEILAEPDATVQVGQLLGKIGAGGAGSASAAAATASSTTSQAAPSQVGTDFSQPECGIRAEFARRARLRLGIQEPSPSAAAATSAAQPAAATPKSAAPLPSATGAKNRQERRVPVSAMRSRVFIRMKEAQDTAALLNTFQEVDLTNLMEMRSRYNDQLEKTHGVRLGVLAAFAKASASALGELPSINAFIDDEAKQIVYRDTVDICAAISGPRGAVSPVIRNVASKSLLQVERDVSDFVSRSRKDQLGLDDFTGGTFGITDGSAFGSMLGTATINPPQSAMLALNAPKMRASVVGGKVVARPIMYLSLAYDHRLIDGREAVTFLCSVRDKIEDPRRMLIEL